MEIIIAILWYMHLLLPGTNYTQAEVETMIQANQKTINAIQIDTQQTQQILIDFNTNAPSSTKKIIEEWKDPPPDPILD